MLYCCTAVMLYAVLLYCCTAVLLKISLDNVDLCDIV